VPVVFLSFYTASLPQDLCFVGEKEPGIWELALGRRARSLLESRVV
jgi:hypothetical protein